MSATITPDPDTSSLRTLPRVLGLFDSTMIVVGSIIGSGVFLKASTIAKVLPSTGLILAVWIVVGVVTLCGCLALAELAAMLPEAGGPYIYLREAYGKLPAFLWGWTEFWIVRTASLGALSAATVLYLNVLLRDATGRTIPHAGQAAVAMLLVILLSWINIKSTRWSALVQNVTGVIKVAFLAALIVLPFVFHKVDTSNLQPIWPQTSTEGISLWRGIGLAILAVMWPYDGWINIAPVAEEIRDPQRNVPRALAWGMGIVILVYVAANSVYHLVLSFTEVQKSNGVAADVWHILFDHRGVGIAAAGVMCSTFGAVNSNMLAGPRIYFAMARDRLLPEAVSSIHHRYETPHIAVILQGAWTLVLIAVAYAWKSDAGDAFDALTDFAIFGGTLFYAMAVGAVYVLRYMRPTLHRPYRTWGYPITPGLYLLMFVAVATVAFMEKWLIAISGTSLIFAGVVYYAIWTRLAASAPAAPISKIEP